MSGGQATSTPSGGGHPVRGPGPRDITAQTRTPATPGADGTAGGGAGSGFRDEEFVAAGAEITEDTGLGISAVHHGRIFERFYRVDQGRSRESGGAGLGLATARWAVEVNGGRIELESEEGKGSLFRIVLPVLEG